MRATRASTPLRVHWSAEAGWSGGRALPAAGAAVVGCTAVGAHAVLGSQDDGFSCLMQGKKRYLLYSRAMREERLCQGWTTRVRDKKA